jgi:uncharacterized membrane protein
MSLFNKYRSRERKSRSFAKAISWRIVAFIVLGTISFLFTGSWEETAAITIVYTILQIFVYFLHERLWDRIQWGSRSPMEQLPHSQELSPEEVAIVTDRLRELGYIE